MTSFGTTVEALIQAADRMAMEIITAHKAQLEAVVDRLLTEKEITGEAFAEMLKK